MIRLTVARQRLPRLQIAVDLGARTCRAGVVRIPAPPESCAANTWRHLGVAREPLEHVALPALAAGARRLGDVADALGERAARVGDVVRRASPSCAPRSRATAASARRGCPRSPRSSPSRPPSAPRTRRSGCRRGARSPCRDGSAPCAPRSASARPCSAGAGCCTGLRGIARRGAEALRVRGEDLLRGALGRRAPRRACATSRRRPRPAPRRSPPRRPRTSSARRRAVRKLPSAHRVLDQHASTAPRRGS